MMEFRLETDRLVLRDWREEDWPEFFRLTNTPAVMRWLGLMNEEKQADQRARVEACAVRNGHCFWVVERKADGGHLSGEMLGFCGLKRADVPGSPVEGSFEIGWRMREDSWGQGYAKEAAIASLEAGFARFEADEIVALTVPGNEASWGLMLRLGMRRREDLDFRDDRFEPDLQIVHSIARDEWAMA